MQKGYHMNVRHMRYFSVLGDELHFRRAAARLHISQPALSRSIQHLEEALGFPLLERDKRNVALTPAGAVYLDGCRSMIATLDTTLARARRAARGQIGEVRIGYTDIAVAGILPNVVRSFRSAYPGVTITANHGCTQAQIDDLDADRLDVGFLTGPWSRPGYETWTVQTDSLVAVLPERHRLAAKPTLSLDDFADEPFVTGDPRFWAHFDQHFRALCTRAGFQPRVVQHASNNEGILGLVACGIGVSIQAETIRTSLRNGVVMRDIAGCAPEIPTLAAWRTDAGNPVKAHLVAHVKALYRTPSRAADLVRDATHAARAVGFAVGEAATKTVPQRQQRPASDR
jgi:DNA-binding transcriptional LysR family regulator